MSLDEFCSAIGVTNLGNTGRIASPTDLHHLYSSLCHQDTRTSQRSKNSCMQFPEIRYFAYYLARENTSNSTNLDLAIMLAAVAKDYTYSIGAQIARRVSNNASRGPYFGGIIASHILFSQSTISVEPDDELMLPKSLDFNSLSYHGFFKGGSAYGEFDY